MEQAKKYLKQLKAFDMEVKEIAEDLKYSRSKTRNSAMNGTERVSVSRYNDGLDNQVGDIIEKEILLSELAYELIEKRHEVIEKIHNVDNALYMEILFKRFVEYKPLKQIAKETGNKYNFMRAIQNKVLNNFEEVNGNLSFWG